MSRLSISDSAWLLIEGRQRPMHVGGLQIFELPDDAPPSFARDLVAAARDHDDIRAPFSQRLAHAYGRGGLFQWVHDDDIELDYHFRHVALPDPGRVRELLAMVSRVHAHLLDRHRPLWESYLIEGLEGGRIAAYTKTHHSMMDGVGAMRQLLQSFSDDPDERDALPPWAAGRPSRHDRDDEETAFNPIAAALRAAGAALEGVTSTAGLARVLTTQLVKAQFDEAVVRPFQAPNSMLNVRLTGSRRFVAQSYSLERIRAVGKQLDATINDVVLAMCSGALRTYLTSQGALPDKPLIALVPVSFRKEEGSSGNAISLIPANLATHLDDPVARLDLIRTSMNSIKARIATMSTSQLLNYGLVMSAPIVLGQLTGLSGRTSPPYNLVISNVPGPSKPLYWNGARMTGLYPLSLLTEGQALNITQTSYDGSMEFGITADRNALPEVQRLIDYLDDALTELEVTVGS